MTTESNHPETSEEEMRQRRLDAMVSFSRKRSTEEIFAEVDKHIAGIEKALGSGESQFNAKGNASDRIVSDDVRRAFLMRLGSNKHEAKAAEDDKTKTDGGAVVDLANRQVTNVEEPEKFVE